MIRILRRRHFIKIYERSIVRKLSGLILSAYFRLAGFHKMKGVASFISRPLQIYKCKGKVRSPQEVTKGQAIGQAKR